jgi:hypothetical protein
MNDKLLELAQEAEQSANLGNAIDIKLMMKEFARLIIREHLIIWEQMDNGNKVAGYIEIEDYPKAIIKHFGYKRKNNA